MNKTIQKQLSVMAQKDQEMRRGGKWKKSIDQQNTSELKKIIKQYDWPDEKLVGKKGATHSWLIVQHADHDVKFQKDCLQLMADAMVPAWQIAYLTDRVNVNENRPQIYGTQFYLTKNNRFIPRPIKNRGNLNQRRKKAGLEPFEKYKQGLIKRQKNNFMIIKEGLSKQKLNQILKKWQKKLRLTAWSLSIKIIEFKRKDYRQSGDIKVNESKKRAVILLTNNPFRNEEAVIVHELVHLLLWNFDHFCERQILKTCKKFEGAHDKYMGGLEETVDKITKTLIK